MTGTKHDNSNNSADRAIALAEAALYECDQQGFIFAAIDISLAIDKLKAIRAGSAR